MGTVQDGIGKLRGFAQGRMDLVEQTMNEVQTELDTMGEVEFSFAEEMAEAKRIAFDEGLAQAGQVGGPGKVFSNEEFEAELALRIDPLNNQINDLTNQVANLVGVNAGLQSQVEGMQAQIDGAVVASTAAIKADMLAKYESQQVAETEGETGFVNYLKS